MHKTSAVLRVTATLALMLALVAGLFGVNGPDRASAGEAAPVDADICLSLLGDGLLDAEGNAIVAPGALLDALTDPDGLNLTLVEAEAIVLLLGTGGCVGQVDVPDPSASDAAASDADAVASDADAVASNDAADASDDAAAGASDDAAGASDDAAAGASDDAAAASDDAAGSDAVDADICLSLLGDGLLDADGNVIVAPGALLDALTDPDGLNLGLVEAEAIVLLLSNGGCVGQVDGADPSASDDAASDDASASDAAGGSDDGSSSASASASAPPVFDGAVIEAAVTITGSIQESADRAGQYDYFYEFVQADAENDIRLAGEGEQQYFVAFFAADDGDAETDELRIVDSGFTSADGTVTLDAPADEDYFIFEAGDFNDPFGSQSVPAGSVSSFFVVEFVLDIDAAPSASGSGSDDDDDDDDNGSAGPSRGDTNQPGGPTDDGDDDNASSGGAASRAAAASNAGSGATALPNTGAGGNDMGSSMTWALFALLAVVGVAAAGIGLHRRNV